MLISRKKGIPRDHPPCHLLRHLTASSFDMVGLKDQGIVAYVSDILVDFTHVANVYRLRDGAGQEIKKSLSVLMEAEEMADLNPREVRRHIGDYCLFFTCLYPDSLEREQRLGGARFFVSQGKKAYHKASEMDALAPPCSPSFESSRMSLRTVSGGSTSNESS